jgi:hypothetical protein
VTGRRGRRRRKLLDDLKERRGYSHLEEEGLDDTMWRARFGRGFGPFVRMNEALCRFCDATKICLFNEAVCISDYEKFYDRMIDAR